MMGVDEYYITASIDPQSNYYKSVIKAKIISKPYSNVEYSKLNPHAKEWDPIACRAPEEYRCLFLTFSNGYPLTETQIINFFNRYRRYGPCVERVYVHQPEEEGEAALFGKVVFKGSVIPAAVMMGHRQAVKFLVDKEPLWCKKFQPKFKLGLP